MSMQWYIHTNTRRTEDEILAFLRALPGAGNSTQFPHLSDLVEYRGQALVGLSIPRAGSAEYDVEYFGFLETISILVNWRRSTDRNAFRETVYRVASAFAEWDQDCDFRFTADDNGILRRRQGHYLVNPHQFETPALRALLPGRFTVADPPEHNLEKARWPLGV